MPNHPIKKHYGQCALCKKSLWHKETKHCGPCSGKIKTIPAEKRFWNFVEKTATCWLWKASKCGKGYGAFAASWKKHQMAHKFSWIMHNGPIQNGLFVMHHCDNPSCVRPDHLWLGSNSDNMRDMIKKGRGRWS